MSYQLTWTIILYFLSFAPQLGLSGQLPWSCNFDDATSQGWTIIEQNKGDSAKWKVINKSFWHISPYTPEKTCPETIKALTVAGQSDWKNYCYELELKSYGEEKGYGVVFYYQDKDNYYCYLMHRDPERKNSYRRLIKVTDGKQSILKEDKYDTLHLDETGQRYLKVELFNPEIRVSNGDGVIFDVSDDTFSQGKIGLICFEANRFQFDDIKVTPIQGIERDYFLIGPYLQSPGPESMTIMWETASPSDSVVYYGQADPGEHKIINPEQVRIHSVTLTGLKRETSYFYQVGSSATVYPEINTFQTAIAKDTPFRLAVWGDNRTFPEDHKKVITAMLLEKPELAVNVGDVVTHGAYKAQWRREFFQPAQQLIKQVPFYVAIGNHERNAHWFYDYFSFPEPENYYSFNYGNTHFVILDTNDNYYLGSQQYKWLVNDSKSDQAQQASWRFVFFHHPPYSEGWDSPHYDGEWAVSSVLIPLFEQFKIDMVFAGHTHDYERGELNGIYYIITGGGGAPLDHHEQNWAHITSYHDCLHYCVVDIKGKALRFVSKDVEGNVLDSLEVKK